MPKRRNISRKSDGGPHLEAPLDCRCFICDVLVKNNGIQIVLGRTPYSNIGLPAKIGQLIGDSFMVVVGVSDTICAHCASLISHLDKLETDACAVKKTLVGYIAAKYQLNHKEVCTKTDQIKKACETHQTKDESPANRIPVNFMLHDFEAKSQLENLEVHNKNIDKMDEFTCDDSNFLSSGGDATLTHQSVSLKLGDRCTQCGGEALSSLEADQRGKIYLFTGTCKGCPVLSFNSEEAFVKHMAIHIVGPDKCAICGFFSPDEAILNSHLLTHGSEVFCCMKCSATHHLKAEFDSHVRSHMRCIKCFNCSTELDSQGNMLNDCELSLGCSDENNQKTDIQSETKAKNFGDLMTVMSMESLMKSDGFESDGSHIEFHSCPTCGLTFLNKILFSEHLKMHDEYVNQVQVGVSNPISNEEVLKTAAVSVTGDCSIDDDLEDLFEKLHAETTNSSLVANQAHGLKRSCPSNNSVSDLKNNLNGQGLNFSDSLKSKDLTCVSSSILSSEISQSSKALISNCSEAGNESEKCQEEMLRRELNPNVSSILSADKLKNNLMHPFEEDRLNKGKGSSSSLRISAMNIEPDLVSNSPVIEGDVSDQNMCQESLENIFDSTDQPTFIYISSSGDDDFLQSDTQGMVLHNATIDPESGDIHLLPYILNDKYSPSQLQSAALECELDNTLELQDFEKNFSSEKTGPEPSASEVNTACASKTDILSCNFCDFQTSIELVLKRHLKSHRGNLVQKCSICNRAFTSSRRLLTHLDLRHKGAGPIVCPFCFEDFENPTLLREHYTEKHPVGKHSFPCRFCQEKFSTKKLCLCHEEGHSEVFKFQCDRCLKKFTSEDDLDEHVKWEHDKAGQCRYCGKQIDKPKALRNHEIRHMQESNHHECQVCQRVFKTKTGLRHHAASHTGQFNYCCDFCGRGFMSRMMLEEHRSCHTKEERYVCDVCGQKFTFQSTYWIHRKWHETPYPYKCTFCGRFFKHSSLLAVHKRKHTGERPYKCPHCPLTFPVSGTLKRHIILHTGVYPFNCDTCKRGFTTRHKYASHLTKVHGIKDVSAQKSLIEGAKEGASDLINNELQESAKFWGLDDVVFDESENIQVLSIPEETMTGQDGEILINDQNIPSRVVEIVLDESYQAVATVTLAEVAANQSVIPDNWFE